jgi:hypothetical protein
MHNSYALVGDHGEMIYVDINLNKLLARKQAAMVCR